ncbi:MAG: hypothetical protein KAH23_06750, partial [Kiritimatiellae bacterium]|nr:hypothetical protein [Kiritimatiellia bacterium]
NMGRPAPKGCSIKVGLGLKATYDRVIAWDPHNFQTKDRVRIGRYAVFKDGTVCVATQTMIRLYDKDGKYLRTLAPHPANISREKLNAMPVWVKTIWGDELCYPPGRLGLRKTYHHGFWADGGFGRRTKLTADPENNRLIVVGNTRKKGPFYIAIGSDGSFMFVDGPGSVEMKNGSGPVKAKPAGSFESYGAPQPRIDVDPVREEIYVNWSGAHMLRSGIFRYDGKTGELDKTWPKNFGADQIRVGPDGLIYASVGPYTRFVVRVDHSGKPVPFANGVVVPKEHIHSSHFKNQADVMTGLYAGGGGKGSSVQQPGFAVSANGTVFFKMQYLSDVWVKARFKPDGTVIPMSLEETKKRIKEFLGTQEKTKRVPDSYAGSWIVGAFGPDGSEKSISAVPGTGNGRGIGSDRWGNFYQTTFATISTDRTVPDGLDPSVKGEVPVPASVVKFRGGVFPLGRFVQEKNRKGIRFRGRKPLVAENALWAYDGISPMGGSACSCGHAMFDVDPYGRSFVPAAHLFSVMVIDGNGNRILRIGRYGNPDSQGPGSLVPEPEIAFSWVRAVTAGDHSFYALDYGNRRILKARLSYHETHTSNAL